MIESRAKTATQTDGDSSFSYLEHGYPIATGVIEGTCRHLVNDRMDITGACWRLDRAEAVLRIRALRSNRDPSKAPLLVDSHSPREPVQNSQLTYQA